MIVSIYLIELVNDCVCIFSGVETPSDVGH